jgi:hypothetical protein
MIYVTAIKPSTASTYKGITHYRWLNSADGKAGTSDRASMIKFLDEKKTAQVAGEDGTSTLGVFEHEGTRYVRTYADKSWNNNLESLPKL